MSGNVSTFAILFMAIVLSCSILVESADGDRRHSAGVHLRKLQALRAFVLRRHVQQTSPPFQLNPKMATSPTSDRVYRLASTYGADPSGINDSTEAILAALSDAAAQRPEEGFLIEGIANLGGARIDLEGGLYKISRPLRFPSSGIGNIMIQGGTLKASDSFPTDGYLIDLSGNSSSSSSFNFEFVTMKDLMLDCNFRGGGISVMNSLRIGIDSCYIVHFSSTGIFVEHGHETLIRNSFLGQIITAGGHRKERDFRGTGIKLAGNDNAITDVVIFSAAVGIMLSGQANVISGVHCYNKATVFGGTGILLKLAGLTQTRIVNSYFDFTGIVAEDPVQLHISGCFFFGDAFVVLRSVHGEARGVTIVDNMFTGYQKGGKTDIVKLDQALGPFKNVDQVVVDRNTADDMMIRSTVSTASVAANGTSWTVDFRQVLLFPDTIKNVQYTMRTNSESFPVHALRSVSDNRVVIESDRRVQATVYVNVDQGS